MGKSKDSSKFIEYKGEVAGGHIYYNLTERVLYEKPVDSAINKHVKAILLLEMIKIARKNNRPINEIENLDDQYKIATSQLLHNVKT